MFGIIGDIASEAFGGVLDAMGFDELKPLLSTAIDIFSGDWLGAAEGLMGIAANTSADGEARQSASSAAPIAEAFSGLGGGSDPLNLKSAGAAGGFDDVIKNFINLPEASGQNGGGILKAANAANLFVNDADAISQRRAAAAAI